MQEPLYNAGDVAGKQDLETIPVDDEGLATVVFDNRSASIGVAFEEARYVHSLTAVPTDGSAVLPEGTIELYVRDGVTEAWKKVGAAVTRKDDGSITATLERPERTTEAKLHCTLDARDENLLPAPGAFSNEKKAILRVEYFAEHSESAWTFDAQGNRLTTETELGEASLGFDETSEGTAYTYWPNSDRVRTVTLSKAGGASETWAYVYDKNGNLTEKGNAFTDSGATIAFSPDSGDYVRYTWDLWSRLARVEKGVAGTASALEVSSYRYDVDGMRIAKSAGTKQTTWIYAQDGTAISEIRTDGAESVRIDTVWANGRILGWTETDAEGAKRYWAAVDQVGSVTGATDADGKLASLRDHSAYGERADSVYDTASGPRYTGKDFDEDAGLYYFNARWYDAELGRFVSEDPVKDGTNWYAYVGNRPIVATDPSGLRIDDYESLTDNEKEKVKTYERDVAEQNHARLEREKERRIKYNKENSYTSADFIPGSTVSGSFLQQYVDVPFVPEGTLLTAVHTGIDRQSDSAQDIVAPIYLLVVASGAKDGLLSDQIVLEVIGLNRQITIMHLDPKEVAGINPGEVFAPGDKIVSFPKEFYRTSGRRPHVHFEEVGKNDGIPVYLNPDTHAVAKDIIYTWQLETRVPIYGLKTMPTRTEVVGYGWETKTTVQTPKWR